MIIIKREKIVHGIKIVKIAIFSSRIKIVSNVLNNYGLMLQTASMFEICHSLIYVMYSQKYTLSDVIPTIAAA